MIHDYKKIINAIIGSQEKVVGYQIANEIAETISSNKDKPDKSTVENLVLEYQKLFGQASVETCKDALRNIDLTGLDLPSILTD